MARHVNINMLSGHPAILNYEFALSGDKDPRPQRKRTTRHGATLCGHRAGCRRAPRPSTATLPAITVKCQFVVSDIDPMPRRGGDILCYNLRFAGVGKTHKRRTNYGNRATNNESG
jgi:hypothetical protein